MHVGVYAFPKWIKAKILNLNLFRTGSINALIIRQQRLSTRLYAILLSVILCILVLYSSLNAKSVTINAKLLDRFQYEKLQMKYSTTISCPCTQVLIEYHQFVELEPTYDAICSSQFVSQQWIDYFI